MKIFYQLCSLSDLLCLLYGMRTYSPASFRIFLCSMLKYWLSILMGKNIKHICSVTLDIYESFYNLLLTNIIAVCTSIFIDMTIGRYMCTVTVVTSVKPFIIIQFSLLQALKNINSVAMVTHIS